ncbi:MAG: hypothetical protein WA631_17630 [Nitrososphaeraceae archaeon]
MKRHFFWKVFFKYCNDTHIQKAVTTINSVLVSVLVLAAATLIAGPTSVAATSISITATVQPNSVRLSAFEIADKELA